MAAPSLAMQGEQLFGGCKGTPPPLVPGRGYEEASGAHQRQHGFTAAATAKLELNAHVLHRAGRQARFAVIATAVSGCARLPAPRAGIRGGCVTRQRQQAKVSTPGWTFNSATNPSSLQPV